MKIEKVFVIGAGTMGAGVAQVFAQSDFDVTLVDTGDEIVRRALGMIEGSLTRAVQKGKIDNSRKEEIIKRIRGETDLGKAKEADFVVEAVFESLALKKEIFKQLDEECPPEVILCTNTSSLPITPIAAATKRPQKVIGMHFFNPAPVMKLVEIIRALTTDDETYKIVWDISLQLGKEPVGVNDSPGFASSRILMVMINEAVFALWEGVGDAKAIDDVMKLGMNHPMGPLELADLIGLDICLNVMNVMYEGFQDTKYRPCVLLKKMVAAGYLGRKTKKGFYEYK
ncbi:MAG: 3-hydroxybutyryl-CoA dehydrogenase [bacterium]